MRGKDFYDRIQTDPRFDWRGSTEGDTAADDVVFVGCPKAGQFGLRFSIAVDAIAKHDWREFEGILLGVRQPDLMEHMSRIVGYFSDMKHWNRSKIAELHDRRKGDYGVTEAA